MKTKHRWIVGAAALAIVVALAGREVAPVVSGTGSERIAAVRGLAAEAGLPAEWGDFFALVAWRESRGYATAKNDSEREAAAAGVAYERNKDRYESCGWGEDAYRYSGGWFGMMPANALAQLPKDLRCLPPSSVFDPRAALAMAVGMARGLMQWKGYGKKPTWLNLRVMWGAPGKGGDASYLAAARSEFAEDAAAVGLAASWLDRRPPPLNVTPSQVLGRLNFEEQAA